MSEEELEKTGILKDLLNKEDEEEMTINEMMDATLFIVRQDYAEKDMINETISRLTYVKNNVVGIVFNSRVYEPGTMRGTYGYRYGYNRYRTKGGE